MNNIIPKTELLYQKSKPIDQLNIIDGIKLMVDEQKKAAMEVKKSSESIECAINKIFNHLTLYIELSKKSSISPSNILSGLELSKLVLLSLTIL